MKSNILAISTILAALVADVAGLAYNPHEYYGQGERETVTVTKTEQSTPTCNCPLETIVTTTTTARCFCPKETIFTMTVTGNDYSNCVATRTSGIGTGTGTTSATPTCSLSEFPNQFFIKDSSSRYLAVDLKANRALGVPRTKSATKFHVISTNDGSITGIPQLAFNISHAGNRMVEYRAFIQYPGGPVQFFNNVTHPDAAIVTATYSSYLCEMELITWMEHDLSYPENCQGALWLDGGRPDNGCVRVRLTVSEA